MLEVLEGAAVGEVSPMQRPKSSRPDQRRRNHPGKTARQHAHQRSAISQVNIERALYTPIGYKFCIHTYFGSIYGIYLLKKAYL